MRTIQLPESSFHILGEKPSEEESGRETVVHWKAQQREHAESIMGLWTKET